MNIKYRYEGEGEVAFLSAKRQDPRNKTNLMKFVTLCHDAQLVWFYQVSNPPCLTVLAAKSEDYTTAPQHLYDSNVIIYQVKVSSSQMNATKILHKIRWSFSYEVKQIGL